MDIVSADRRSSIMARIRSKDTKPELAVRKLLHEMGYRYRLHVKDLPGRPDVVFRGRRKAIFVHGCFWHSHQGCKRAFVPKSRARFWKLKMKRNRERDVASVKSLELAGWRVLIVWECQVEQANLASLLKSFLDSSN